MSYIRTYTGRAFDPGRPDAELIDIRDVAHALSMICRGNGHVKTFFSVAQHCINCALEAEARGLPDRVILACLLHDAGEAYMSDVPRPYKKSMPEYVKDEERLMSAVYEKFLGSPLTEEESCQIKEIDDDLLYYDLKDLLGELQDREAPQVKIIQNREFVPFEKVEQLYLELYEKWRVI